MKTWILFLIILSLFLVYYKIEKIEKSSYFVSGPYPDKVNTSKGYFLGGYTLDTMKKYSKAVSPSSVLFVEVDTIKGTSTVYSVYTVRHDIKKKSLAIR